MKTISGCYFSDSQDPDGRRKKTVLLGGKVAHVVYHDGNDDVATKAADDWAVETIGAIEKRLGRRLTKEEIRRGLAHAETMSAGDVMRQKAAHDAYFQSTDTDDRSPLERARDARKAELKAGGDARLEMLNESVAREKEDAERKAEKAKRDADPRRQACIADAGARTLAVLFDPDASMADVRDAEFRERVARDGDPVTYQRLTQDWQRAEATRRKAKAAPLRDRLTLLSDEIAQTEKPFTLPATTVDYVPGESVDTGGLQFSPGTLQNQ